MKPGPIVVRCAIAALIVALPVLVGAIYSLASGIDPADTWSDSTARAGAPTIVDDSVLVDARRATGEASSQAGLLTGGTKQLVDGVGKITGGTDDISTALTNGKEGTQKLSDGMTQLQAATGQMGQGATKVADGVETAVNQVTGFEAVRGQIVVAIDGYLERIKDAQDPDTVKLREDLGTLRQQATTFTLDDTTKSQLEEMKTGSREIAQQLSEPGQAYHDGIYTATKGAQDLNAGLGKATTDLETALKSVDDLRTGSARIDTMAKNTQAKIGEIQRALPTAQSHTDTDTRTLAPMYAVLIAAGVLFGATIRGSGRIHTKATLLTVVVTLVGLAVTASLLCLMVGFGLGAGQVAGITAITLLLGMISILTGSLMVRIFGGMWGQIAALMTALAQVGIVGWAWNLAATTAIPTGWLLATSLMPLHYATSGLVAFGNSGGSASHIGISLGVMIALCVSGLTGLKLLQPTVGRRKAS